MAWISYFWKWFVEATPIPIRIVEIVFLFLAILGLAVKQIQPNWVAKMDKLAWQIPLGLLVAVFLISLAVSSYNLYNQQTQKVEELTNQLNVARKQAYPPVSTLMMTPYFKDLDIPLGEFGQMNNTLADKTFERCRIHGPIVVFINNSYLTECALDGDFDSTFIFTTNEVVNGVLHVINCTFIKCTFDKVGFIGPQKFIDEARKMLVGK